MSHTFQQDAALKTEILAEAKRDYLGLWWIVRKMQEHMPSLPATQRRAATLEFLRRLLESRELVAGEPRSEGQAFARWDGSASEILGRIEASWPAGANDPDIGGDIWFTSPS